MTATNRTMRQKTVTVAICGNPNSGKTTIFNALTGLRQKVGNYPGVTVEKVSGRFTVPSHPDTDFILLDIPGSYSLSAFSPDEFIATRALLGNIAEESSPDVIVCVIDATNLERGLYLLFQVMQVGRPVVAALNMIDLAERRGITIDADALTRELGGVPVVPIVGNRRRGIDRLRETIAATVGRDPSSRNHWYGAETFELVAHLANASTNGHRSQAEYLRILFDADGPAEREFVGAEGKQGYEQLQQARRTLVSRYGSLAMAETRPLTDAATEIFAKVTSCTSHREYTTSERIDRVLLHPVAGPLILLTIMTLMFQSIFSWSEPLMNVIDSMFSGLSVVVTQMMSAGPLRSLLTDGVIGGVGSVLVFLPQIVILFIYIAILEDTGYMPRAAFLVDRLFGWCGLSGKSFIPMLSSFACAVPGIMASRTIEDRKLRLLTIIVSPLMSCSARLPVYTIMIAAFIPAVSVLGVFNLQGVVLTILYLLGIVVAVIVSFLLNRLILKTDRGTFLMEMPSYKLPTPQSVIIRVYNRAQAFLLRAGTVILAITIVIWALSYYPQVTDTDNQFAQRRAGVTQRYEDRIAALNGNSEAGSESLLSMTRTLEQQRDAELAVIDNARAGEQLRNSYLGRAGRTIEPLFRPLGWDWRITMATLASFPAREVVIATLGTIFNLGTEADETSRSLVDKMRSSKWLSGKRIGRPLFTPAVALSIMVFFALSCQCGATLATMRQETNSKLVPVLTFLHMTTLAYLSALVVFQLFSRLGW